MNEKQVVTAILLGLFAIVVLGVFAFVAGGSSRIATYALYVVGAAYMFACLVVACRSFARCIAICRQRGDNH